MPRPTPLKEMSSARKVALASTVLAGGALAGLIVAEGVLRWTRLGVGPGSVSTVSASEFERVPGIFEPGQDATITQVPQLPYRVMINSLGYRGEDFARAKAPGEFRILFSGDSLVFGDFVDDDETLPAQFQQALTNRCGTSQRVVNAGLGGSSIGEQTRMIERGLTLDPDLVVLQFSENDVQDLAGPSMWDELASNREAKSAFPLSIVYPILRKSALWNLALRTRAVIRLGRVTREFSSGASPDPSGAGAGAPRREDAYRRQYRERLAGLSSMLERAGVPFVLAVFPAHMSVYRRWDSDQLEWLDGVIEELGLTAVKFMPSLTADGRSAEELYLLPYDGHPSPEGYRIAAGHLTDALIPMGLLPGRCVSH
jgi:lysophospholipase L1-like esterase